MDALHPNTGLTDSEHRALERFLTARTVPLTYQVGGAPFVQGTGSFYRTGEDLFLVTAAHVLEGIDPSELGVPDRPFGSVSIWNLNDITIYHPKNTSEFDVALIRFLNPDFVRRVVASWQCIDESQVTDNADELDEFLIAGYPTETVQYVHGALTPAPMLQLFTKKYQGTVDPPAAEYDLMLRYRRTGTDIVGNERKTPALGGVSGALAYAKVYSPSPVWSPETMFRPVGIQVSMKHDEYVRVKRWSLIDNLVNVVREQRI